MQTRTMKRVEVLGTDMAYVEQGEGPVVLFQHGNPTSSYLWRNVIPYVAPRARCIAADLVGFGQSGKPDISFRVTDHARYFDAFIEALGLTDIVLVLHDWGSALGLDWARRHGARVRSLVLMEFIWPIPTWLDMPPERAALFKAFRDPGKGRTLLIDENRFVEQVLPGGIERTLSAEEMDTYRAPFREPASREPVYRFPNELPIAGEPVDVCAMVSAYHDWLLATDIPKLFFSTDPGAFIPPARAAWYAMHLRNCRWVALGAGKHFMQEDHPDAIGTGIAAWLATLP